MSRATATPAATLTIGDVAAQAGVGIDTVRYYERAGLLPEPPRRTSGYRAYPADTVARLQFIRRAKALGFSLAEITELLALSQQDSTAAIRSAAQSKLAAVQRKLDELERIRCALQTLIAVCPGHGPTQACPILHALSADAS